MTDERRTVLNHIAVHGHARNIDGIPPGRAAEHVIWLVHDWLVRPTSDPDMPLFYRPRHTEAA